MVCSPLPYLPVPGVEEKEKKPSKTGRVIPLDTCSWLFLLGSY